MGAEPDGPGEGGATRPSPGTGDAAVTGVLETEPRIPGEHSSRVAFTAAAVEMLQQLVARHGQLMIHQSGGCCDGSSPMCYPTGDFLTGEADVLLGHAEVPLPDGARSPLDVWMSREQFAVWKHTHLTIDLVDGRGGGFSLESPEGKRFLLRSRLLAPEPAETRGPDVP